MVSYNKRIVFRKKFPDIPDSEMLLVSPLIFPEILVTRDCNFKISLDRQGVSESFQTIFGRSNFCFHDKTYVGFIMIDIQQGKIWRIK